MQIRDTELGTLIDRLHDKQMMLCCDCHRRQAIRAPTIRYACLLNRHTNPTNGTESGNDLTSPGYSPPTITPFASSLLSFALSLWPQIAKKKQAARERRKCRAKWKKETSDVLLDRKSRTLVDWANKGVG